MNVTDMPSGASERASRFLPVLLLLFAGSGCSALIYEIVWYQLLQFAIGSTAVSLGFLLATFMGGLGLGSWLLPRIFPKSDSGRNHPLRLYAWIEAGIAICALVELALIPLINGAYVALAMAMHRHPDLKGLASKVITDSVAAISVGLLGEEERLDLEYVEDRDADVDMNLVMTGSGKFIEVQGTGEEATFTADQLFRLIDLGRAGIAEVTQLQRKTLNSYQF